MAQFIVSLTGPDRPGMLSSLARMTHDRGGKWLSSKVCRLGGQFAGMIHIEVPQSELAPLQAELKQLPEFQLMMTSELIRSELPEQQLHLTVDATDRPGIVSDITHLLDSHSVSVDRMQCRRLGVSSVEDTLFTAELDLSVPAELDEISLISDLEALGQDLDISIRARTS